MNIVIIGFGVMGQAIAQTLAQEKSNHVFVVEKDLNKASKINKKQLKIDKNLKTLKKADFVILAVKPQDLADLAENIHGKIRLSTILISIAAGASLANLKQLFDHNKVVRVMPNLGLSVGAGIAAWKMSSSLTSAEKKRVKKLLNQICENFEVKHEDKIHAVTAISGSGPAYFFFLAESLFKAAKSLGFDEQRAKKLVEKTFLAGALLQNQGTYAELIKKIASKKGTTEAALKYLTKQNTEKIIITAVQKAYQRAKELRNG